jgi:hypothetical protein
MTTHLVEDVDMPRCILQSEQETLHYIAHMYVAVEKKPPT